MSADAATPTHTNRVLLENVIESLGDAVLLTDAARCVRFANQAAEELLQLGEQQLSGRSCRSLFAKSPWLPDLVERVYATGQSQACAQEVLGTIRVRALCSPVLGPNGSLEGIAIVLHDLSYQIMLEEEVRRNEALARLGMMVAGLAHEVKNPLGGIKGAAQLLAKRIPENNDVRTCTDIVIREADRLSNLVEQLLLLGGPRPPALCALNVHKVLRGVLDLMAPVAQERGIRVRAEFDPSLPDISGDEAQLSQVFLNLTKNAFEAMPEGGTLTVTTRVDTDLRIFRRTTGHSPAVDAPLTPAQMVRIRFMDSGPGFAVESLPHIFEPFFTTKHRGTGLGLAVCRQIVAAHGGDIRAENNAGQGASISVMLPWARETR